ncbi:MAG: HAD hydrolase-like protein [Pseudomonadota bacterium]
MDSILLLDHALPPNLGPPEAGIFGLHHSGGPEATPSEEALRRAGVTAGEALLVGDIPATDGAGAARAGLEFALVQASTSERTDDALDEARVTHLELLRYRHR